MNDNFRMVDTSQQSNVDINIDYARKKVADLIYNQAILEGVVTTYENVNNILNSGQVNGMTSTDIMKVVNLKHAWEFVLDENVIMAEENFSFLSQIKQTKSAFNFPFFIALAIASKLEPLPLAKTAILFI